MNTIDFIYKIIFVKKFKVSIFRVKDGWHCGESRYFLTKRNAIKYFNKMRNSLPMGYMLILENCWTDKTVEKWNNLGEPPIFIPSYQRNEPFTYRYEEDSDSI